MVQKQKGTPLGLPFLLYKKVLFNRLVLPFDLQEMYQKQLKTDLLSIVQTISE